MEKIRGATTGRPLGLRIIAALAAVAACMMLSLGLAASPPVPIASAQTEGLTEGAGGLLGAGALLTTQAGALRAQAAGVNYGNPFENGDLEVNYTDPDTGAPLMYRVRGLRFTVGDTVLVGSGPAPYDYPAGLATWAAKYKANGGLTGLGAWGGGEFRLDNISVDYNRRDIAYTGVYSGMIAHCCQADNATSLSGYPRKARLQLIAERSSWNADHSIFHGVFALMTDNLHSYDIWDQATLSTTFVYADWHVSGNLEITKGSGDATFTDNNDCYTLAGARYEVFRDATLTESAGTLETDEEGKSGTLEDLPVGTYYIKETKAPAGYALDGQVHEAQINAGQTTTVELVDEPQFDSADIILVKADPDTRGGAAQGGATLENALFRIDYYKGIYEDAAALPATAERSWVVRTGADGKADLNDPACKASGPAFYTDDAGRIVFPLGTLRIVEVGAPHGYNLDNGVRGQEPEARILTMRASGSERDVRMLQANSPVRFADTVQRGNIELAKSDAELARRQAQGDATLGGAVYQIVNASDNPVISPQTGAEVGRGGVVCSIVTDESGFASTARADLNGWAAPAQWDGCALAYGSYIVREAQAGEGYLVNILYSGAAQIASQGAVAQVATIENVKRGGIVVGKVDREFREHIPLGSATLAGAVFEIANASTGPVVVDGTEYAPGAVVKSIATALQDDGRYCAVTEADALPYGTYTVRETATSAGYLLDSGSRAWSRTFSIRENGQIIDLGNPADAVSNQVIRGDFNLTKVHGSTMERLAGIPFKIVSKTTGESHVAVTDENGMLNTAASWNAHTEATNANDAADNGDGTADASRLDSMAGIWFYGRTDKRADINDNLGALPYDSYRITELSCAANDGLALVAFDLTITRNAVNLDMGTVDDGVGPSIATSLADGHGVKMASAEAEAALTDTVSYENLPLGSYLLEGELHLVGEDGADEGVVAQAQRTVSISAPQRSSGTTEIEFTVNTAGMAKKSLVAFERLSNADDGALVAAHEDLSDEGQTVTIPEISTRLAQSTPQPAGTDGTGTEIVTLTDNVSYAGLDAGRAYTMEAVLHLRGADGADEGAALDAQGKPITAHQSFTPRTPEGTCEVTFTFARAAVAGKTVVAFEELHESDAVYAVHADIASDAQSATVPAIGTTAHDAALGGHTALAADDTRIIDTVSYSGFEPNTAYEARATLHVRAVDGSDAGPLATTTGSTIGARVHFVPEAADGTIDIEIPFDASTLAGKTVVVFEEVLRDGEPFAEHADISDEGQSIAFPRIATQAQGKQSGTHRLEAEHDAAIIDTVAYENLEAGRAYRLVAVVHERGADGTDLGAVVDREGSPVGAELAFSPSSASGSVDVEIPLDTTALSGKTLVVFEELFDGQDLIAKHADIADTGQSVSIGTPDAPQPDAPKSPPKATRTTLPTTGDPFGPAAYTLGVIAVSALAIGGVGAALAQRATRRRRIR